MIFVTIFFSLFIEGGARRTASALRIQTLKFFIRTS